MTRLVPFRPGLLLCFCYASLQSFSGRVDSCYTADESAHTPLPTVNPYALQLNCLYPLYDLSSTEIQSPNRALVASSLLEREVRLGPVPDFVVPEFIHKKTHTV